MANTTETITIENVVATTAIGQELNLDQLADDLPGADYDRNQFTGIVYRTQEPKATSLIFRSGKIVTTGAPSEADTHTVLGILFEELAELSIQVANGPEITVQNIVSTADLGQTLNLNAIAIGLGLENVEYEPEQFPGLVYRPDDAQVVLLLFGSGKVVITGGKTAADASQAVTAVSARLIDLGLMQ